MKTMLVKFTITAALLAAAIPTALAQVPCAANNDPFRPRTLAGIWIATINIPDPPPGVVGNFQAFHLYTLDGRFIDRNTNSALSQSNAFGEWGVKGLCQYATTFLFFQFDEKGVATTYVKVRSTITLSANGDEWSGPFVADLYSIDGKLLAPGLKGTHSGKRIRLEAME